MSINFGEENTPLRRKLEKHLSDGEWHTWKDLTKVAGTRFGARLLELKREGFIIDRSRIDVEPLPGEKRVRGFKYRLRSTIPGEPQGKRVKALLPPSEVDTFLTTGKISGELFDAIADAFASYQCNAGKL
ncbi:MAG: hypothetical protein ACRCZF_14845 [Gemmataceae bacterium]